MSEIIILGAGLAGLSAAYHLKRDYQIYEKNKRIGGLCRSEKVGPFTFDYGPHILFPKYKHIAALIQSLLSDNLLIQSREAWIFHKFCDRYTRFPFQAHLYGLPVSIVKECLLGLFHTTVKEKKDSNPPKNYEEWIHWNFGEGIAKYLMIPYAKKIWTVSPKKMNYDWVKYRVPRPELADVLEGALSDNPKKFGFNTQFWYPFKGGIESLPLAFLPKIKKVNLEKEATRIIPEKELVEFNGAEKVRYKKLVSTLPLLEILNLMENVPDDVTRAARNLQHNSVLCVNLGIDRVNISNKQWVYFYEDDFSFHRISFPMNFSPKVAPEGQSSVSTEISYSKYKPINKETIVERAIKELVKGKILYPDDKITVTDVLDMKYAYIIYDHHHRKNVTKIHSFLRSHNIYPCGRFGEWEYFNMDDSLESGRKTAEELNRCGK